MQYVDNYGVKHQYCLNQSKGNHSLVVSDGECSSKTYDELLHVHWKWVGAVVFVVVTIFVAAAFATGYFLYETLPVEEDISMLDSEVIKTASWEELEVSDTEATVKNAGIPIANSHTDATFRTILMFSSDSDGDWEDEAWY